MDRVCATAELCLGHGSLHFKLFLTPLPLPNPTPSSPFVLSQAPFLEKPEARGVFECE